MGVIPLKIRGEMPAVGFTSYNKMHGIKRHLEHLMGHHRLRSIRNNYRTNETAFSHVEIKETYGINYPKSKSLFFFSLLGQEGKKSEFLGAIVEIRRPRIFVGSWALSEDA